MELVLLLIGVALAGLVGYSAQHASICSVRAVAEALDDRDPRLLASFVKSAAWALAVAVPLGWTSLGEIESAATRLGLATIAGGVLFGLGATLNDRCAISTISHLASGDGSMLVTLAGFAAGSLAMARLAAAGTGFEPAGTAMLTRPSAVGLAIVALCWIWVLLEARRLILGRGDARTRALARAAIALGLGSGIVFVLHGPWAYSAAIVQAAGAPFGGPAPAPVALLLFAALLAGGWLSAWREGRFRLRWGVERRWQTHLAGGALMGCGAALVPGGNDAVLLNAVPLIAEHALPAYAAMLLGVALGLMVRRRAGTRRRASIGWPGKAYWPYGHPVR